MIDVGFQYIDEPEFVEWFLSNPKCYHRMVNDAAPAIADFRVDSKNFVTVLASVYGAPVAIFLLFDLDSAAGWVEVHFCFDPCAWGSTEEISSAFLAWLWKSSTMNRLIGPVPGYNRMAYRLAKKVGFAQYGTVGGVVKKGGEMYDLLMMEVTRPNV